MTLTRKTTWNSKFEPVCSVCDTIHIEWYQHKDNRPGSSKLYVECNCVPQYIFQQAYLITRSVLLE